jgi:anti-sigma factor RsiW
MNVTREVILDLLPVYLAGEASPATRALVDEYLQQDPELAQRVRTSSVESLSSIAQVPLSSDIELRSLRRARALLGWQRWLFGLGITFTALSLSNEFSFAEGHFREFHFLIRDYPAQFGSFAVLAALCWISYYAIRRRLRFGPS